jgi:copper chaperone CopZ
MKTIRIEIENLKCHGCANTIKKEIGRIPEVTNVSVIQEDNMVIIDYDSEDEMKDLFTRRLAKLGYPEKGNKKFGNKVKSYVSCAIGRMSKEEK